MMQPITIETKHARYIVIPEYGSHTHPDLSLIRQQLGEVDSLVVELNPAYEKIVASPDFPYNRNNYMAVGAYLPILKDLVKRRIPVAVPDPLLPEKYTYSMYPRIFLRNPAARPASLLALLLGGWLVRPSSRQTKGKQRRERGFLRRTFLKSTAVAAGAAAITGATGVIGAQTSSPVLALEGRNAILADRCEHDLAPLLERQLGRKPVLLVHLGAAHEAGPEQFTFTYFLQNRAARMAMLQEMAPEWEKIGPPFDRFRNEMFLFHFGTKAGREVIRVPPLSERLKASGARSRLPPSRRDLWGRPFAALRRAMEQKGESAQLRRRATRDTARRRR